MMGKLSEAVLISRIARSYYLDGQSRSDIAATLGISRFRVSRLLNTARDTGIVSIEIRSPGVVDTALSIALEDKFDLRRAVVLDVSADDEPTLRARLGAAAGALLSEVVVDGDVVGLSWSRSLANVGAGLNELARCQVVQMTGALSRPDGSDVLELVRQLARAGGGAAHVFYAPMIVEDAITARTLRRQPEVARALGLIDSVSVALVGVGSWRSGQSTIYDAVSTADRDQNAEFGVVAEVSGVLVGADGRPRRAPLSRRAICPTGAQLRAVPNVIAVAYGAEKADGICSVLLGSLVNSLVTHTGLAQALLQQRD